MKNLHKPKAILFTLALTLLSCLGLTKRAYAESFFQVSPMNQMVSLTPGERYYGTFKITNPNSNPTSVSFELTVSPFYVDENNDVNYENNGDYNQIVDWITLEHDKGTIQPNETQQVHFYIDVPEDAPAGGQYATILATSVSGDAESDKISIANRYSIAHLVYAEVAGETVRKGDINNVGVQGFIFSGKIAGTSTIKNLGNVHSDASSTLQVFPLFSDEEIYTNEENPTINTILPGVARSSIVSWEETPSIGIFHVIYNIEFEGVNQKVDKMVIVCPLWLLFIIVVIIFLVIFKILSGKKEKK